LGAYDHRFGDRTNHLGGTRPHPLLGFAEDPARLAQAASRFRQLACTYDQSHVAQQQERTTALLNRRDLRSASVPLHLGASSWERQPSWRPSLNQARTTALLNQHDLR
jgi:hypothetical protein